MLLNQITSLVNQSTAPSLSPTSPLPLTRRPPPPTRPCFSTRQLILSTSPPPPSLSPADPLPLTHRLPPPTRPCSSTRQPVHRLPPSHPPAPSLSPTGRCLQLGLLFNQTISLVNQSTASLPLTCRPSPSHLLATTSNQALLLNQTISLVNQSTSPLPLTHCPLPLIRRLPHPTRPCSSIRQPVLSTSLPPPSHPPAPSLSSIGCRLQPSLAPQPENQSCQPVHRPPPSHPLASSLSPVGCRLQPDPAPQPNNQSCQPICRPPPSHPPSHSPAPSLSSTDHSTPWSY